MLPMSDGGPLCRHRIPILCSSSTTLPVTDSSVRNKWTRYRVEWAERAERALWRSGNYVIIFSIPCDGCLAG